MDDTSLFAGGIGFLFVLFLLVLAILWFLLPFAVFGIKDLLKELIRELKASRSVQMQVLAEIQAASVPPGAKGVSVSPPAAPVGADDTRTLAEIMATKPER